MGIQSIERVVIIGSGNLAEALAQAVSQSGLSLVQVFSRNADRAKVVATLANSSYGSKMEELADADIYIIAVSDRAVAEVVTTLPIPKEAVVAHTAGSIPIEALTSKFAGRAIIYPFQTFTKGRKVDFSTIPIFLEASSEELYIEVEKFAQKLSSTTIKANFTLRAKVHLAGVFACNFTNYMYQLGESIISEQGLSFDTLKPLILETAAKAIESQSPKDVQTGPAIRNDKAVLERHINMLKEKNNSDEIYKLISENIWETSKKI